MSGPGESHMDLEGLIEVPYRASSRGNLSVALTSTRPSHRSSRHELLKRQSLRVYLDELKLAFLEGAPAGPAGCIPWGRSIPASVLNKQAKARPIRNRFRPSCSGSAARIFATKMSFHDLTAYVPWPFHFTFADKRKKRLRPLGPVFTSAWTHLRPCRRATTIDGDGTTCLGRHRTICLHRCCLWGKKKEKNTEKATEFSYNKRNFSP